MNPPMTDRKELPRSAQFENGARFSIGTLSPPSPYPTVTDVRVVPFAEESLRWMQWVSEELGLLSVFLSEFIEPDPRWRPVGSRSAPFTAIEQGWAIEIWEDDRYVHVHQGGRRLLTIETWYRVPKSVFNAEWRRGVNELRAMALPVPRASKAGKRRRPVMKRQTGCCGQSRCGKFTRGDAALRAMAISVR